MLRRMRDWTAWGLPGGRAPQSGRGTEYAAIQLDELWRDRDAACSVYGLIVGNRCLIAILGGKETGKAAAECHGDDCCW